MRVSKIFRFVARHSRAVAYLLIFIGIACLVASWQIYRQQPKPSVNTAKHAVDADVAPSAVKPKTAAIASYTVAPTLPKYITIPALSISNTRVIQLGLMGNGQIATPNNIYDTGWYNASAKPGQSGAMFIYGHVSNWQADGVFYNLKKLKAGDAITITRGDNITYTYQVVSTKIYAYDAVDMNQVLTPVDATKPGLNLMTCTGQVIKGTNEFNQRLVVFTKLI